MSVATFRYILFADAAHKTGQLNPAGYPRFALASAIIMVASILISARGTHRYIPLLRPTAQRRITLAKCSGAWRRACGIPNSSFRAGGDLRNLGHRSWGGAPALFQHLFLELTTKQIGLFGLAGLASAFLAPFMAGPVSKRLGKKNAALVFYFSCIALAITPISLRLLGLFLLTARRFCSFSCFQNGLCRPFSASAVSSFSAR